MFWLVFGLLLILCNLFVSLQLARAVLPDTFVFMTLETQSHKPETTEQEKSSKSYLKKSSMIS